MLLLPQKLSSTSSSSWCTLNSTRFFLIGMSSPHIIEIDYVVRPPMLVLFPKSSRKDQEEEEEEEERAMDQLSKVLHEGEDDNFTLPTSSLPSSSQDGHGQQTKMMMREVEVLYRKNIASSDDVDDDDGYHTPTSPRHQIPAVLECPPAPRRKSWQQRRRKRGCAVCLCLVAEIDGDDDHMLMVKAKKARE